MLPPHLAAALPGPLVHVERCGPGLVRLLCQVPLPQRGQPPPAVERGETDRGQQEEEESGGKQPDGRLGPVPRRRRGDRPARRHQSASANNCRYCVLTGHYKNGGGGR